MTANQLQLQWNRRTVINQAELTACLNEIKSLQCNGIDALGQDPFSVCDQVVEGQVDLGGECGLAGECAGDAFCDYQSQCPGICTPRRDDGEACLDDEECRAPSRCYDVCQPPKQEGEMCNPTECDEGLDCEEGVCVDVSFAATFTAGNGRPVTHSTAHSADPILPCILGDRADLQADRY